MQLSLIDFLRNAALAPDVGSVDRMSGETATPPSGMLFGEDSTDMRRKELEEHRPHTEHLICKSASREYFVVLSTEFLMSQSSLC
jgi:hypothetical protein